LAKHNGRGVTTPLFFDQNYFFVYFSKSMKKAILWICFVFFISSLSYYLFINHGLVLTVVLLSSLIFNIITFFENHEKVEKMRGMASNYQHSLDNTVASFKEFLARK
jgi:hypothetical protein